MSELTLKQKAFSEAVALYERYHETLKKDGTMAGDVSVKVVGMVILDGKAVLAIEENFHREDVEGFNYKEYPNLCEYLHWSNITKFFSIGYILRFWFTGMWLEYRAEKQARKLLELYGEPLPLTMMNLSIQKELPHYMLDWDMENYDPNEQRMKDIALNMALDHSLELYLAECGFMNAHRFILSEDFITKWFAKDG